jgi:hypothetical protein
LARTASSYFLILPQALSQLQANICVQASLAVQIRDTGGLAVAWCATLPVSLATRAVNKKLRAYLEQKAVLALGKSLHANMAVFVRPSIP